MTRTTGTFPITVTTWFKSLELICEPILVWPWSSHVSMYIGCIEDDFAFAGLLLMGLLMDLPLACPVVAFLLLLSKRKHIFNLCTIGPVTIFSL